MHRIPMSVGMAVVGVGLIALVAPSVVVGGLSLTMTGLFVLWFLGRCRHEGRPALLPPSTLPDGGRTPARWFCSHCGKTWDADFRRDSTPVQRYAGFDQTKLPAAAKRAATLDRERQNQAVRRAGISAGKVAAPRVAVSTVSTVVPIEQRRRIVT